MRVGAGIILSVLSFSVFAEVTSDYDYHGPLLVRRAVNPVTKVVLWKRADEKQTGPGPSSSGSGAGASSEASTSNGQSNPDDSGINSELKKLDRFRNYVERLYKSRNKSGRNLRQKMVQWRDKKLIKFAIKIVTKVVQGKQAKQIILIIKKLLTTVLESTRITLELFNKKAKSPLFSVFITKGKTQKTVTKEMVRIQGLVKEKVKGHLNFLSSSITTIIRLPQTLRSRLDTIARQVGDMVGVFRDLYAEEYTKFISIVGSKNNKGHIKAIEKYISEMTKYRSGFYAVTDYISEEFISNRLKLEEKASKKTSTSATRAKKRPGMKTKPPTDETPDQEASDQGVGQFVNGIFG
ncbi:hypothetical protein BASA83_012058 [Batrachochytrium salamandrivorans]|nr:hypothetical protein BASA83_012058 [Batrachochytrium salamandrivorans]